MKVIDLPITQNFSTQTINIGDAIEDLKSGKIKRIPLGTIDLGTSGKELEQARINGGIVIWSAICLEQKLEAIVTKFLFPINQDNNSKNFFSYKIIKSSYFTYAAKKNLVLDIINQESLLKGKKKDRIGKGLKDVMDHRNAFAHGDMAYQEGKGCILKSWNAGPQNTILNEAFWNNLQSCFQKTHALIDYSLNGLKGQGSWS